MSTHKCSICGIEKPITEYYNHSKNGAVIPHAECKSCTLIMNKLHREEIITRNTDEHIKQIELVNPLKQCLICKQLKPITDFCIRRSEKDGHNTYCKDCSSIIKKQKHREHKLLPPIEYVKWREKQNAIRKASRTRIKLEVFTHYCKGTPKCANPFHLHSEDITDLDLLTLDHINGDGYKERKELDGLVEKGAAFYRYIKKQDYPPKYQILCWNCQAKKKIVNHEFGEKHWRQSDSN